MRLWWVVMGKWLNELLKFGERQESALTKHSKGAFVSFECADSGGNQKYPAVWQVVLSGSGRDYSLTVIDPEQLSDDGFMAYLAEKFGAGRVVSARRRTGAGANQSLSS